MTLLDIIKNNININWCDSIVYAEQKAKDSNRIIHSVGVKYKETDGDRQQALELAIERLLE
jgi:hypothetical protein